MFRTKTRKPMIAFPCHINGEVLRNALSATDLELKEVITCCGLYVRSARPGVAVDLLRHWKAISELDVAGLRIELRRELVGWYTREIQRCERHISEKPHRKNLWVALINAKRKKLNKLSHVNGGPRKTRQTNSLV